MSNTAKNVAVLGVLLLLLPTNAALVAGALLVRSIAQRRRLRSTTASGARKTILISGGKMTKALQLARSFSDAGHRVVLAESARYWFTGHRFSRAVDRFYALPKPESPDFANALAAIVKHEQIDLFVPVSSPASSVPESKAIPLLAASCDVMHVGPMTIQRLDDKYQFAQAAEALGLRVPKSLLITDPSQVERFDFANERRQFIVKSIAYDSVRRLNLTKLPAETPEATAAYLRTLPISEKNPWVMQEFIPGTEYCTHGTVRDGKLLVHACCTSSAFQLNYQHVEKPAIEAWVTAFAAGIGFTGQASFDFIEADDDGSTYAIECNPRTHSAITMFYNHPELADGYLRRTPLETPLRPLATSRPTYWLYHELMRLMTERPTVASVIERLTTIVFGKEAVFDWRDPLPFLMLYHWHIPLLLLRDLREGRGWFRIDFNIGKLVQPGGD